MQRWDGSSEPGAVAVAAQYLRRGCREWLPGQRGKEQLKRKGGLFVWVGPLLGVLSGQSDPGNNFSQAPQVMAGCPGCRCRWLLQGTPGAVTGSSPGAVLTIQAVVVGEWAASP